MEAPPSWDVSHPGRHDNGAHVLEFQRQLKHKYLPTIWRKHVVKVRRCDTEGDDDESQYTLLCSCPTTSNLLVPCRHMQFVARSLGDSLVRLSNVCTSAGHNAFRMASSNQCTAKNIPLSCSVIPTDCNHGSMGFHPHRQSRIVLILNHWGPQSPAKTSNHLHDDSQRSCIWGRNWLGMLVRIHLFTKTWCSS